MATSHINSLPSDLYGIIFKDFTTFQILPYMRVCKRWQDVIVRYVLPRTCCAILTLCTDAALKAFQRAISMDLSGCKLLTNNGLLTLQNLRYVNLARTALTDEGCIILRRAEWINVAECDISDAGVTHFQNAKAVNLSSCKLITSASMKYLQNAEELHIDCTQITDDGLAYLSKVKRLYMRGCSVTSNGLGYLTSVQVIDISDMGRRANDEWLRALSHVQEITMAWNYYFTYAGLIHLKNAKYVGCWNCYLPDEGLKMLRSAGVKVDD